MKIKPKDKMFVEGYEGEVNEIWKESTIKSLVIITIMTLLMILMDKIMQY